MLALPSIVLGVAILLFAGMVLLVSKEQKTGQRKILSRCRGWLDRMCDGLVRVVRSSAHTVTISCVYIVHQLRHAMAAAIAPRPRRRSMPAKLQYEHTDNHLSSMHEHKADTALSEAQKKKLRNKKLEERF